MKFVFFFKIREILCKFDAKIFLVWRTTAFELAAGISLSSDRKHVIGPQRVKSNPKI